LLFIREKLRDWWTSNTYRFVELSKANKSARTKLASLNTPVLNDIEKQQIITFMEEALHDFYENNFLNAITKTSLHTVEHIGATTSMFIKGPFIEQQREVKNRALFDHIFLQHVPEKIVEKSIFRITYDTTPGEDIRKIAASYNFTQNIKKIFDNIFHNILLKTKINEKRLLETLSQFFIDIVNAKYEIKYHEKFVDLLALFYKKRLIPGDLYYRDEVMAVRTILASFISVLKTVHVQIIPKASTGILSKDIEKSERTVQKEIKQLVDALEKIIKQPGTRAYIGR